MRRASRRIRRNFATATQCCDGLPRSPMSVPEEKVFSPTPDRRPSCPRALRARSLYGGRTDSHHRTSPFTRALTLTNPFRRCRSEPCQDPVRPEPMLRRYAAPPTEPARVSQARALRCLTTPLSWQPRPPRVPRPQRPPCPPDRPSIPIPARPSSGSPAHLPAPPVPPPAARPAGALSFRRAHGFPPSHIAPC